uniref:Helicase ATP-binding domain-containing protein n=1 Tax=Stegastes partitus TaxID=144197 RepID=A0A3B5A1T6_9TELE
MPDFSYRTLLYFPYSYLILPSKAEREQLPVFQHRHRVLEALQRHRVVVVAGETGSGKSTQIPQFLLEELLTGGKAAQSCNIVVTQPRRISAMSLSQKAQLL